MADESRNTEGGPEPFGPDAQVFILPFAVPEPFDLPEFQSVDSSLLARRLPDFLHQVLNGGGPGPIGMLEIHSPPGDGPTRWVTLPESPSAEELFEMLSEAGSVSAVVTGTLGLDDRGLKLDMNVHWADGGAPHGADGAFVHGLHGVIPVQSPARGMSRLAKHLAHVLGIRCSTPTSEMLTDIPQAFYKFLEGLEGAALLSGDAELETEQSGEQLVAPFADALSLDPRFGMALRTAAMTFFVGMEEGRVEQSACLRLIDRCYDTLPTDGEGCVAIAEQLASVGDEDRAIAWLRHAVRLDPPSARALESLGVMLANRGDLAGGRELWERGLDGDGHPDFSAHLARLAFSDGEHQIAWDRMREGLRRKRERTLRAAEWDDSPRPSILLRYLAEHLEDEPAPDDIAAALIDLSGVLQEPAERVDLGLCLVRVGRADLAESELEQGLTGSLPSSTHDLAMTALLEIQIPDFERRFAAMRDLAAKSKDPRPALIELQAVLDRQPAYWPAMFWIGVAMKRLGQQEQALDVFHEVLSMRPGQVEVLAEAAALFDLRGNPKRALECIEEALLDEPESAELHGARALYLERLDRRDEAAEALDRALEQAPEDDDLKRRRASF